MKYFYSIVLTGLVIILGCGGADSQGGGDEQADMPNADNPLLGSWKQVSYVDASDESGEWLDRPKSILYEKHVTPTHFTWYSYDKEENKLLGCGGGTYNYSNGIYTENIDFFMPPGSNELGQAIPFSAEIKDGKWYHTGYAKEMAIDEETGNVVMVDSTKIEEIWERVNATPNSNDLNIISSWELQSYREADSEARMEYPEFIKYIKHITPTHFVWVKYNGEGDEVFEAGAGTYVVADDTYTEVIQMMYPPGSGTVGTKANFTYEIDGDTWMHMGYVNRININKQDKPREDLLIDEVWHRMKK